MKTIVFDFDGTLTKKENNVWYEMWKIIDALDVDEMLYNKYYNKEIDYNEWCREIEKEYIKRGFNHELLDKASEGVTLIDGLEETLKVLKNNNYHLYIVSGGVDKVIKRVLGNLVQYFDDIYCCKFEFDSQKYLKRIIPTRYDDEGKKWFIDEYCLKKNINPNDITFIGNDINDEYVHLSGCRTICLNPSKKAAHENSTIWNNVIRTKNIKDILPLLGLGNKR